MKSARQRGEVVGRLAPRLAALLKASEARLGDEALEAKPQAASQAASQARQVGRPLEAALAALAFAASLHFHFQSHTDSSFVCFWQALLAPVLPAICPLEH